jgi:hypothetical protein
MLSLLFLSPLSPPRRRGAIFLFEPTAERVDSRLRGNDEEVGGHDVSVELSVFNWVASYFLALGALFMSFCRVGPSSDPPLSAGLKTNLSYKIDRTLSPFDCAQGDRQGDKSLPCASRVVEIRLGGPSGQGFRPCIYKNLETRTKVRATRPLRVTGKPG